MAVIEVMRNVAISEKDVNAHSFVIIIHVSVNSSRSMSESHLSLSCYLLMHVSSPRPKNQKSAPNRRVDKMLSVSGFICQNLAFYRSVAYSDWSDPVT